MSLSTLPTVSCNFRFTESPRRCRVQTEIMNGVEEKRNPADHFWTRNRNEDGKCCLLGKAGKEMSMVLEIRPESGFLNVDAVGKFSLNEAKRTFLEMLEAAAQHKSQKVLFDGRKLTGKPELIERFYYGSFAARAVADFRGGVLRFTIFAYVLKEPVLDPRRFGETVAVNRGMSVKVFDNLEDAVKWLGVVRSNKSDAANHK